MDEYYLVPKYKIDEKTVLEKLPNTILEESFDDFAACEDKWTDVEGGYNEVMRFFKTALEVSLLMNDEEKIKYCQKDNIVKLLESGHVVYSPFMIYRIKTEDKKCPLCGCSYTSYEKALSRRDNETYICSLCAAKEAVEDFVLYNENED